MNKSIDFAAQDITEEGIDFLIKVQKQKGTGARSVNYNLTEFDRERSAMCDGDAEAVYEELCPKSLKSFCPTEKTYSEIKKIMEKTITGITDDDEDEPGEIPGEEEEYSEETGTEEPEESTEEPEESTEEPEESTEEPEESTEEPEESGTEDPEEDEIPMDFPAKDKKPAAEKKPAPKKQPTEEAEESPADASDEEEDAELMAELADLRSELDDE